METPPDQNHIVIVVERKIGVALLSPSHESRIRALNRHSPWVCVLLADADHKLKPVECRYLNDGSTTALVWGAAPQTRSDRRKDRVETNPEQLAAASAQAEISIF
eukprot:Gb_29389 [translate_table: standard]